MKNKLLQLGNEMANKLILAEKKRSKKLKVQFLKAQELSERVSEYQGLNKLLKDGE